MRQICYESAIDTKDTVIAYLDEFHRLKDKIFINKWANLPLADEKTVASYKADGHITLDFVRPDVKKITIKTSMDLFVNSFQMTKVPASNLWISKSLNLPPGSMEYYFLLNDKEKYVDPFSPIVMNALNEICNITVNAQASHPDS